MINKLIKKNDSVLHILYNIILATISLFINGLGVYLTIKANVGAGPWDVLNLGLSNTFRVIYGTASITVSFIILAIDILMKEPIGVAMVIDAIVVGKSVDFFNYIHLVSSPKTLIGSIIMIIIGLFIIGYTQVTYMLASLGCGPRDTLLVGLKKRIKGLPIGVVSIILLSCATFIGYLLGGKVGIGTLIIALLAGPIMQFAFSSVKFKAENIKHQNIKDTISIIKK